MSSNHSEYGTTDFALATAVSLYYPIGSIERNQSSNKATFIFHRDDGFDELLALYHSGQLTVEPQRFFEMQKRLKQRLYDGS